MFVLSASVTLLVALRLISKSEFGNESHNSRMHLDIIDHRASPMLITQLNFKVTFINS